SDPRGGGAVRRPPDPGAAGRLRVGVDAGGAAVDLAEVRRAAELRPAGRAPPGRGGARRTAGGSGRPGAVEELLSRFETPSAPCITFLKTDSRERWAAALAGRSRLNETAESRS